MKNDFQDIASRIKEEPSWWDDNGTPRYGGFSPEMIPDSYANEAVLFLIRCRGCGRQFRVALHRTNYDEYDKRTGFLLRTIKAKTLGYGEPPNVGCCCGGATTLSEPMWVIEYWKRDEGHEWVRLQEYDEWLLQ